MKIQLKGIVRNTSGAICPDGELEELVNVHFKDGTLRPVPLRSTALSNVGHTNVYIHTNSGFKHFLGVSNNNLYYFADEVPGHNIEKKAEPVFICSINGNATFTQIGNVVNILDSDGLKYAVWYDSSYRIIDSNFDGNATDENAFGHIDLKVDGEMDSSGYIKTRAYRSETQFSYGSNADANTVENQKIRAFVYDGLHEKALSGIKKDGFLNGFVMAITAIELYDGSYIMHSNPVLLNQAFDRGTRYKVSIGGVEYNHLDKKAVFMPGNYPLNETVINNDGYANIGIPTDLSFAFVPMSGDRAATQTYSIPSVLGFYGKVENNNEVGNKYLWMLSAYNRLKCKVNSTIDAKYKPLIKSLSVFITPEISMYKTPELKNYSFVGFAHYMDSSSYHEVVENYLPPIKTNEELIKEIGEQSVFYKVHEIPFEDISTDSTSPIQLDTWIDIDLKGKLGDLLVTQQALTYDNFSHHKLLPDVQFVYNSKLHIGDYKNILSRGHSFKAFSPIQGVGQFQTTDSTGYWGNKIDVYIKTSTGVSVVTRYRNPVAETVTYSPYVGMLSYPDARAFKMVITSAVFIAGVNGWVSWTKEFKLKSHSTQNYSYYIQPDLKPFALDYTTSQAVPFPNSEINRQQVFSNTVKVSEVNNPFSFPVENTYPIGNGQIIGFATNTIALSTGQAGQFPVYIFCTDGIYALYIGGAEVNYASSRPISREVCNNALSIKPVDSGVLFTTDEGIKVIAGAQVNDISEVLRGDYFDIAKTELFQKAVDHKALVQLTPEITDESILEYIASSIVGYNKKGDYKELWFTNPSKSYSYVFAHGIWHKVKQTGQAFINDYPKQYLLSNNNLIDLSSETGTGNETMFLTRPLKLGDQNFKQMLTCILHGHFKPENALDYDRYTGLYVFGSYDCQRWQFLGGTELKGERRDIGTITEKTSCKYFRVGFVGNLSLDSTIDYIEITGKQSILSKKDR